MKHRLKLVNDIYYLYNSSGKPCICPYKSAIPIQDKFGSLQILNNDCNSMCPHFETNDANNNIKLHCTNINLVCDILSELEPL